MSEYFDVLIIGAGLSGIGAARHLIGKCADKSFVVIESRHSIGGTWDLFRYPGIRSDSDMFTLGYEFKPWPHSEGIADGEVIRRYIVDAATEAGIDKKIRFSHKVMAAEWSDKDSHWTVRVLSIDSGESTIICCRYMMMCSGYYEFERAYTPEFAGSEQYEGAVIHPQFWPQDLDYAGKRIVVIGSGATAITLVPAIARKAAHVVMLQRSPSYVLSLPQNDPSASGLLPWLTTVLPASWLYKATRVRNLWIANSFYKLCRRFPNAMRRMLLRHAKNRLPDGYDMVHFTPQYAPWDQRLCLAPDGDLFAAICSGSASVVTDQVASFTQTGLRLKSGQELAADIIVTATGLRMNLTGGVQFRLNNEAYKFSDHYLYKGMMYQNLPNLFRFIGYTNASWTLKTDLIAQYACRLINHIDECGARYAVPRVTQTLRLSPLIGLTSGYIRRAADQMPKGAAEAPWRLYNDYANDKRQLLYGPVIDDCMEVK